MKTTSAGSGLDADAGRDQEAVAVSPPSAPEKARVRRLELPLYGGPWSIRRFADRAAAWAFFERLERGTPPPLRLGEPQLALADQVLPAGSWVVIYCPIIF